MKLYNMVLRNVKLFFKDKGMLFSSLITPIILLVLYATFLAKVYKDSFTSNLPEGFEFPTDIIDGFVAAQLFSSLLAVCCVTVTFCANLIMIQDKVTGARNDLIIAPIKKSTLALGYYLATAINAMIICLVATGACFIYMKSVGWYLSGSDVAYILFDVLLLVLFGTALSSLICSPLSTEGQMSAVGTVVSSGYGFICGAYMPISQFGTVLQKVISFLPGTYGTSLLRNHAMRGCFEAMDKNGIPEDIVNGMKEAVDCNLYFFDRSVSIGAMYAVLAGSVAVLVLAFVIVNMLSGKRK